MSSILKALKKLEEEKARREGGGGDIARDILRGARRRRSGAGGLWLLLIGVACGAGLVAAAFSWWSGTAPQRHTALDVRHPEPATEPEPVTKPQPALQQAKTGAGTSTAAEEPAARSAASGGKTESSRTISRENSTVHPVIRPKGPAAAGNIQPAVGDQGKPAAMSAPAAVRSGDRPSLAAGDGLQLTGIAWQADRQARMAIIDDLPVMEGTIIEGAKVMEILPDRVRLDRNGQIFELFLER